MGLEVSESGVSGGGGIFRQSAAKAEKSADCRETWRFGGMAEFPSNFLSTDNCAIFRKSLRGPYYKSYSLVLV